MALPSCLSHLQPWKHWSVALCRGSSEPSRVRQGLSADCWGLAVPECSLHVAPQASLAQAFLSLSCPSPRLSQAWTPRLDWSLFHEPHPCCSSLTLGESKGQESRIRSATSQQTGFLTSSGTLEHPLADTFWKEQASGIDTGKGW